MTWADWLILTGLLAAGGGGAVFGGDENRLVNAVLAVGVIGAAWSIAYTQRLLNQRLLLTVAAGGVVVGAAVLVFHKSREAVCTATNASGRRVVIGTELTPEGQKYRRDNPGDDNDAMLEALGDLNVKLGWTEASIRRCRVALNVSGALWIPLLGVAGVAAAAASRSGPSRSAVQEPISKPRVFISYAHEDAATAARLTQLLRQHRIDVIIDTENMSPGERIPDFIDRSIRDCHAVVSLLSGRSLMSGWVGSETAASIGRNKRGQHVAVIACYLDDDWLEPEFRLRCTEQIDARLRRIDQLLAEYAAKKIDPADLNEEHTRLYHLRNNLGTILGTFKDSLCLDVRGGEFQASGERLVATIRSLGEDAKLSQ